MALINIGAAIDPGTMAARIVYYPSTTPQTLGRLISADKTDFVDWTIQETERLSTQTLQERTLLGTNQFQVIEQEDMFNQDPGRKYAGPSHAAVWRLFFEMRLGYSLVEGLLLGGGAQSPGLVIFDI